jgi:hypothetical protein
MEVRGWDRAFDDPIPLPDGRELRTLRDAGNYIAKLPKAEQHAPEWATAIARRQSVHRIPPSTSVTIAKRPLCDSGTGLDRALPKRPIQMPIVFRQKSYILKRIGFCVVSELWLLNMAFASVGRRTVKIRSKLEAVGVFLLMKPGGISPSCACLGDWR